MPTFGQMPLTGRISNLPCNLIDPEPPPSDTEDVNTQIFNEHYPNADPAPHPLYDEHINFDVPGANPCYTDPTDWAATAEKKKGGHPDCTNSNCIVTTDVENAEIPFGPNSYSQSHTAVALSENPVDFFDDHVDRHSQLDTTVVADDDSTDPTFTTTGIEGYSNRRIDPVGGEMIKPLDRLPFGDVDHGSVVEPEPPDISPIENYSNVDTVNISMD